MRFLKKNLLVIFLILIISFLAYKNYSFRSSYSTLEIEYVKINQENSDKLREMEVIKEELNLVKRELEIAKSEAKLWASRAYKSGYKDTNVTKITN